MADLTPIQDSSTTYEAPTVSEETLDEGGNYVSPASSGGAGTLGNSIIK
jgi:hypothetical protein